MTDTQQTRVHHHKGKTFGKPFTKGSSGNPGGRSKIIKTAVEAAKENAPEAMKTLIAVAKNVNAPAAARVTAAGMILDRAYGRPAQFQTNLNIEGRRPEELTDQELVRIIDGALRGPGEQLELLPEPSPTGAVNVGENVGTSEQHDVEPNDIKDIDPELGG